MMKLDIFIEITKTMHFLEHRCNLCEMATDYPQWVHESHQKHYKLVLTPIIAHLPERKLGLGQG